MNNKTSDGSGNVVNPAPAGFHPPAGGARDLSEGSTGVPCRVGRWAIRLVHFNMGWRYWVFEHAGEGRGLAAYGFGTLTEAIEAARAAR